MTIIDKLNLSKYQKMAVLNQPSDYELFKGYMTELTGDHDAIFIFVETMEEMVNQTQKVIIEEQLLEKGYLFFAYPKKGNKRYDTFIHRDEIFPTMKVGEGDGYVKNSDLKFSRMVSMDDVFTVVGLKREKKKAEKSSATSQCVADYEENVKDIERVLKDHPNELKFYQGLTPGYKRDWARYIFSAKQQKTRDKRRVQMIDILSQGYKSIDLYRRKK
ncbi:YdeI/OmpD-associated family protein [Alkalihalobacillus sp. MEB130]|uniref:YdeI/OmpD-associated family protein n=1 Tax=Alkalihalobacillus sp. MEB130 TaxID=2976704 RepID=UPI0028DDA80B|nr:YdeI/OmpD-associated family protein [Alkalihalobacillus sp. MEB130]MDT8860697.1 YdeI/OmpD-associated family protein [Alkalihalobacillus sp. MEB130]